MFENYQERRAIWMDYFSIVNIENAYDTHGDHQPEHYISQYLLSERADLKLMKERLSISVNHREKTLLTLLIEEFEEIGLGDIDVVEDKRK